MKMVRQGRFVAPIRLGDSFRHGVRFAEDEVDAWIAAKLAARDSANATQLLSANSRNTDAPFNSGSRAG